MAPMYRGGKNGITSQHAARCMLQPFSVFFLSQKVAAWVERQLHHAIRFMINEEKGYDH